MRYDAEKLYRLLPSIYRFLDESGDTEADRKVLYGLMETIAREVGVVENNLDQLYDDLFIETCSPWVVPYIGDLIGFEPLMSIPDEPSSIRGEVANTIALRRRKGTLSVLEELTRALTGRQANAKEMFRLLVTFANLNHLRSNPDGCCDLRDARSLRRLGGAFETANRTADVRSIEAGAPGYNIPNIGLYVWRAEAWRIRQATAFRFTPGSRFAFDPLGRPGPLYNFPQSEGDITQLATELNVPDPLDRRALYEATEEMRRLKSLGDPAWPTCSPYFGGAEDIVEVWINGSKVAPEQILFCQLIAPGADLNTATNWATICTTKTYSDNVGSPVNQPIKLAIDPLYGLMVINGINANARIEVSFVTAKPMAMGGGGYSRESSFADQATPPIAVHQLGLNGAHPTIAAALAALGGNSGVIEIQDSRTYTGNVTINIPSGANVEFRAADTARPTFVGNTFNIQCAADSHLSLNGLIIDAQVILKGSPSSVDIRHCTLFTRPTRASIVAGPGSDLSQLSLSLARTLSHRVEIAVQTTAVTIEDCIIESVDANKPAIGRRNANNLFGPRVDIVDSTILGDVSCQEVELISNTIVNGIITSARVQSGCCRYSYFDPASKVPHPHKCVPSTGQNAIKMRPLFRSVAQAEFDYARLSKHCAKEILFGADDECEMGAFHKLYEPIRNANLRTRLDEYLRLGLAAGTIDALARP